MQELYSDGTIICHGKFYPIHRFVLSACSDVFEEMFHQADKLNNRHPFIFVKDILPDQMDSLLCYMYKGEVNISRDLLPELIKAAKSLKIKGLTSAEGENFSKVNRKRKCSLNDKSPASKTKKITDDDITSDKKLKEMNEENDIEISQIEHVQDCERTEVPLLCCQVGETNKRI